MGTPEEIEAAVPGRSLTLRAVDGTHSPARDLDSVSGHAAAFLTASC